MVKYVLVLSEFWN